MNYRLLLTLTGMAIAAALPLRQAEAAGEQTGRVRGVVVGEDKNPLPGINITATSPSLIGNARTVVSDNGGRFEILNLPPGIYTLELGYPGTLPARRQALVRQGEAVTVNVTYSFTNVVQEDLQLKEARSLTRPDSTHTGAVRSADSFKRLPVARQYQSVAQLVPGVSGGANPNVKGGLSNHNKYLIDGMDVTDPVSKTFSMNLTYDSIESMEILTGGYDAEYNALGGIINVIPSGGGDEYRLSLSSFINHHELSMPSNQGPNLWEGEQPYNETTLGPEASYEISANVGGPIIPRRLWFGATLQLILTEASLAKGPPLGVAPYNIQHPVRRFLGGLGRLRLDYAVSSRHRLRLSANTDPAWIDNTSQSNSLLGVAETRQGQGGYFTQLRWDWMPTDNITTTVLGGYVFSGLEIGPQGRLGKVDYAGCGSFSDINCSYDRNRPRRTNTIDGTTWHQGPNYRTDNRYRMQLDPTVNIRAVAFGRHNIKAGLQLQYVWRTRFQETPGGSVYQDRTTNRVPLEAGLCDPATGVGCYRRVDLDSYNIKQKGYAAGLFVQDHWWTSMPWLTVVPGMRLDYGVTQNRFGKTVTTLWGLGPRLGLTADVTKDARNVFFLYYGRATDALPLDVVATMDESEAGATRTYEYNSMTRAYNDTPLMSAGGPGGVEIVKNPKIPRTDEVTGGYRREFLPGTVVSAEYTFRRISHDWTSMEVNRIWDPSGNRVVDYVDPNKIGRAVDRYLTPYSPRLYHGLILSSEGRPTNRWEYMASHTLSWTTYRSTISSIPSQARFDRGWSSADLRHYSRLYAAYYLLKDLNLGAIFQYRSQSGNTLTKAFYNTQLNSRVNWRSPSGTTPTVPNDPEGIAEFRPPPLVQLDLALRYNLLPTRWRHGLTAHVDVFNVFNTRTPNDIVASDIASFGQVGSRQRPLRVQVGLSYNY